MEKIEFYVEQDSMIEFAETISKSQIINTITGITEDEEIVILVEFSHDKNAIINKLKEFTDYYIYDDDDTEKDDLADKFSYSG